MYIFIVQLFLKNDISKEEDYGKEVKPTNVKMHLEQNSLLKCPAETHVVE